MLVNLALFAWEKLEILGLLKEKKEKKNWLISDCKGKYVDESSSQDFHYGSFNQLQITTKIWRRLGCKSENQ